MRVLESFREPRATTNPYIGQLAHSLDNEPGCELLPFTFRRAIFCSYDVFHVHWPEVIYTGNGPLKGLIREVLTVAVLLRLTIEQKALVRTRHNIAPHAGTSRRQKALEAWFDRLTAVNIRLNDVTVTPSQAPAATILHGHYQNWFASLAREEKVSGRIAFFGLIRQYKGVENLISAFHDLQDPALTLTVSGRPTDPALQEALVQLASGSSEIEFTFGFLSDAALVETVTQAELVVLPYTFMHNSGAALAALSLDRPVLVPDTEVNRRLAAEVGTGWVYCFHGCIGADDIRSALNQHRSNPPRQAPNLGARSWRHAGADHLRVFENARRLRKENWRLRGTVALHGIHTEIGVRDE